LSHSNPTTPLPLLATLVIPFPASKPDIYKLQPPGFAVLSASFSALDQREALLECEERSVKGGEREGWVFSLHPCQSLVSTMGVFLCHIAPTLGGPFPMTTALDGF